MTSTLPRRSADDAKIAGVCGGIAARYGVDPLLVRIVALILAFSAGAGLILYGLAWVAFPHESAQRSLAAETFPALDKASPIAWLVLAIVACVLVTPSIEKLTSLSIGPAVVIGVVIFLGRRHHNKQLKPPARQSPLPGAGFAELSQSWELRLAEIYQGSPTTMPYPGTPAAPLAQPVVMDAPRKVRHRRPWYNHSAWIWVAAALLIGAACAIIERLDSMGVVEAPPVVYLGVGTMITGLAVIATAIVGKSKLLPLIVIAIALSFGLASGQSATNGALSVGAYSVVYNNASDIPLSIAFGTGPLQLDMSAITLESDRSVTIKHGTGPVELTVPAGSNVVIDYQVEVGPFTAPGRDDIGTPHGTWSQHPVPGGPTLHLVVEQGVGPVEVLVR